MVYQLLKIVTVGSDEKELDSPSFEVVEVRYKWKDLKAEVTVEYTELTNPNLKANLHYRTYEFDCDVTWTDEDAETAVLSLPCHEGYQINQ